MTLIKKIIIERLWFSLFAIKYDIGGGEKLSDRYLLGPLLRK
jgi:hypothetical protein